MSDPRVTAQNEVKEIRMQYNRLGNSGLKVSKIILGAMGYGDPKQGEAWAITEEEALPLLYHAYKRGINTWDTANVYSQGVSEQIIGKAIKHYEIPRERLVIMTKCGFGVDPIVVASGKLDAAVAGTNDGIMVNRVGLSRKNIFDSVDASVKRLGTHIDVLQIHRLDYETPFEETMKALNDVVESGKVRYIGASSMSTWRFQAMNNLAERNGWHKFISMQNYHNLLYREEEREMIPYCQSAGIGLIPWSPLAQGILARPWSDRNSTTRAQNNQFASLLYADSDKAVVDRVEEVSKRLGVSMAVVAGAWSLKKGVYPIMGLNSEKRIEEACDIVQFELSDENMKALEEPYRAKPVAAVW